MAKVTIDMIKELREISGGAGLSDCKNALIETEGDIDAALEVLRKKGVAKAGKKAARIAAEGVVSLVVKEDRKAAIVEVNCETDFAAKSDKFKAYVATVVEQVYETQAADVEALKAEKCINSEFTVGEELVNQIATIGENLTIRRFAKIDSDGLVVGYIHGGGRIGVLVEAEAADTDANKEALKNIAMQIAALNPQYISRADISDAELAKLREITIESAINDPASLPKQLMLKLINKAVDNKVWSDADIAIYEEQKNNLNYLFNFLSAEAKAQVAALGMEEKDAFVADKIFSGLVEGRISKQIKDISLSDQVYVKAEDGKQTVAAYLKTVGDIKIKNFIRFETGEGIEKKQENFAEEVAKQMM
ncbi:MAG: elongation factor Ts [Parasporobacterium sp.]|nr:elongation factor Ts [Parasporobacterium sp.]